MINIITSFYDSENTQRNLELVTALKNNIKSNYIKKIHLFVDNEKSLNLLTQCIKDNIHKNKIHITCIKKPNYSDLFEYADTLINEICMITNNDIYLYDVINKNIFNKIINTNTIYVLTRYEHDLSRPLINNYCGSHDTFIYKAPLKNNLTTDKNIFSNKLFTSQFLNPRYDKNTTTKEINEVIHTGLFFQFYLGSENVVSTILHKLGYVLLNPCNQIITVHEHVKNIYIEDQIRINIGQHFIPIPPINL